ncbi:hypothetical protein COB18_01595 [Candidatus Kaiserbacteria bacterium]|nr:MAG: hypothetical protein COB18_01595 [Candidatus Kaiserbacteria bacterium]
MEPNRNDKISTIAGALFQPQILLRLLFLWIAVVVVGTLLLIGTASRGILTDDDVSALLTENERLALATNVALVSRVQQEEAQVAGQNLPAVFPDRLIVKSLGIDLPVSNPQTRNIEALDAELKSAAVRYPDSATLGEQGGNVLLFGHSSRLPIVRNPLYKAFNDIEKLENGDIIEVVSGGDVYSYSVSNVYQASAASNDRIALSVPGHRITLLTCDSFGKRTDRWVVEAEFIGTNI